MSKGKAHNGGSAVETEGKFYYASGEKIPLRISRHFVAVKPTQRGMEAVEAARGVARNLESPAAPVEVLRIPEHNIALLRLPNGGRAGAVAPETARAAISSEAGVTVGPAVYESDMAPEGAMIPVGEILVHFRAGASKDTRQKLVDKYKLDLVRPDYPEPGADVFALRGDGDTVETANSLEEEDQVEFAEPNFVYVSTRPGSAVGTALAGLQETMDRSHDAAPAAEQQEPLLSATDPAFASQWNLRKIKAPEAWDISLGNPGVSIAIVDEGCDISHEDISYKLPGYDAYAGDNNPQPNGNDAHGTACAGVAAMRRNNGRGGVGVAPGCRVMPIRIAQGIGGGFWSTTSAKVADGIRRAVDAPRSADVLSNSYSVGVSTVVTNAFQYARTNGRGGKGCPIAAAAGNSNAPPVIYPARLSSSIPGMMAVSATNEWDQRKSTTSLDGETWWGSSFGPEVDIAAPGVHIYSPDIMGPAGYSGGNYVPNFNGTSSATPHVAGLMGLILSVDSDLRSWEVEDIIKLSADDLGPAGRDQEFGFGRINCRRALEAASRIWVQISVTPEFIGAGRECFMRARLRVYNPGINTIRLDSLTFTSHNPTWTAEIDRFEYRPNPGNVMAPRTSQDVRLNGILLKANGNRSSWSYRWAASWTYTFWRPSGPGFPLSPMDVTQSGGVQTETVASLRGSEEGGPSETGETAAGETLVSQTRDNGDSVTIDRQSKSITIVIR
ncbi:MAG: S8 family serine peptidase [Bryobacteraceae bacterium]